MERCGLIASLCVVIIRMMNWEEPTDAQSETCGSRLVKLRRSLTDPARICE